jgi:hypothetical protein
MSVPLLVQVHEETRRLAIAGAAVASGDFRLKKLVPALEQAGAKAPVLARVAQATQAVVDSGEKAAPAALLDLASLVHAILYTQGETGIAGEFTPMATTDLGASETRTTARVLKPLLDALASSGSGRLEMIRDAVERGTFRDLRLVRPALNALDDSYAEIADLIRTKVLPLYGTAIVPELRARLDLKGRGGDVHRLMLLHALDPEGTRATIRQALDEGSKEVRVAAVECLGTSGDDLVVLLEQVRSKVRDVRAAALRALLGAEVATPDMLGTLTRAIDGSDLDLIDDRLAACAFAPIAEHVRSRAEEHLASVLVEKDAKKAGSLVTRLMMFVRVMGARANPGTEAGVGADAAAEAFLLRCFEAVPALTKVKSTPSGLDVAEAVAFTMSRGTLTLRATLAAKHRTLTGPMLQPAIDAARATMSPAAFYEEFGPLLSHAASGRAKKGSDGERASALVSVLESRTRGALLGDDPRDPDADSVPPARELDERWLDAALDCDALDLVCRLARPGHARAMAYLAERLDGAKPTTRDRLIATMVRIGHPGAADALIDAITRHAKSSHHGYYAYWYGRLIAMLPTSAYPKFEALLPTLPEKMVDQLIESVLELKNKPE